MKKILALLIVVVAAVTGGLFWYLNGLGPVESSNTEEITVEIPEGTSCEKPEYFL